MSTSVLEAPCPSLVSAEQIAFYRENGFVRVPGIISRDEAAQFHQAALEFASGNDQGGHSAIFQQLVNVWTQNEALKNLTLHPNIAAAAKQLAGVPLRLWHDQLLIKKPHNNAATEFHQDQPYWPHRNSANPISCWIALCDVPVERGCMTFIPKSQGRTDLPMQNLGDAHSLFEICPDLMWEPRVTIPLKAGDCTFHHGRCAHMATPNFTDDPRVAYVVIFIDEDARYEHAPHTVTKDLGMQNGQRFDDELFPVV